MVRRLSGINTEISAIFNLSTQFGGGKTQALTLLYHLALTGVSRLQQVAVATFVGKVGNWIRYNPKIRFINLK